MKVLGIRCSNKDYTFAILKGSKNKPKLLETNTEVCPRGYFTTQRLNWLLLNIEDILKKHDIKRVVMKRHEGKTRGKSYEERVENETMIYLACYNCGLKTVFKKPYSTIAKDLGLKGRARYLTTALDKSLILDYDKYPAKIQDAILAGWSELPK